MKKRIVISEGQATAAQREKVLDAPLIPLRQIARTVAELGRRFLNKSSLIVN